MDRMMSLHKKVAPRLIEFVIETMTSLYIVPQLHSKEGLWTQTSPGRLVIMLEVIMNIQFPLFDYQCWMN